MVSSARGMHRIVRPVLHRSLLLSPAVRQYSREAARSVFSPVSRYYKREGQPLLFMVVKHNSSSNLHPTPKEKNSEESSHLESSPSTAAPPPPSSLIGRFRHWLSRESTVASSDYNRYWVLPGSFLVQLSIGSVYSWSAFNEPLSREFGVVVAAPQDWSLEAVVPIFSCCALTLGICTALLGPWAERSGPRMVAFVAANCWGGGLLLTALGSYHHQLWLCYLGYGVLGGCGWGFGYVSYVSTLMKWFPDRRGLATGLALTAFGGGAMLAMPINETLFASYFELPTYLGHANEVSMVTEEGIRYAIMDGSHHEVVIATAADINRLPCSAAEGVYLVGTGNTGSAKTFATLAVGYYTAMLIGSLGARVPKEGWLPAHWTPPAATTDPKASLILANDSVHFNQALRTPQFYLLWGAVAGNAIAGVSVISCAKTIMSDIFGTTLPFIVTGTFAATFVAALSAGNMIGRFCYANASDWIGRKSTYFVFGLGIPMCIMIPHLTASVSSNPGPVPLALFYGCSVILVSFYGGVFSVLPAYLADIFGPKHVGAIHGRILTAWSAAAVGGPAILSVLRENSYYEAAANLAFHVDPAMFLSTFGEPISKLDELIAAKTVTIPMLLQIAPSGTMDPTPMLYNSTMYSMGGLLAVALVCNALVRPVDPSHFIKGTDVAYKI